jgi:hypothetical protein
MRCWFRFDNGEVHHYGEASILKFHRISDSDANSPSPDKKPSSHSNSFETDASVTAPAGLSASADGTRRRSLFDHVPDSIFAPVKDGAAHGAVPSAPRRRPSIFDADAPSPERPASAPRARAQFPVRTLDFKSEPEAMGGRRVSGLAARRGMRLPTFHGDDLVADGLGIVPALEGVQLDCSPADKEAEQPEALSLAPIAYTAPKSATTLLPQKPGRLSLTPVLHVTPAGSATPLPRPIPAHNSKPSGRRGSLGTSHEPLPFSGEPEPVSAQLGSAHSSGSANQSGGSGQRWLLRRTYSEASMATPTLPSGVSPTEQIGRNPGKGHETSTPAAPPAHQSDVQPDWQALIDAERSRADGLEATLRFERARCERLEAAIEADAVVTVDGLTRLREARRKAEFELEFETRRSAVLCSLIDELRNRAFSAASADEPSSVRGASAHARSPLNSAPIVSAVHDGTGAGKPRGAATASLAHANGESAAGDATKAEPTMVDRPSAVGALHGQADSAGASSAAADDGRGAESRVVGLLTAQLGTLSEQLRALQAEVEQLKTSTPVAKLGRSETSGESVKRCDSSPLATDACNA